MAKEVSMFESACRSSRIAKQGKLVQFIVDGAGAIVADDQEFYAAQKWASSRHSTGNFNTDRSKFLEQIANLIARPGSFTATRGNTKSLSDMVKAMLMSGFDLNDWDLPPDLKKIGKPKALVYKTPSQIDAEMKAAAEAEAAAAAQKK